MIYKFNSAKGFVVTMMENEGSLFCDSYGREWKYQNYNFTFKDIGSSATHVKGLKCLHLFDTHIEMIKSK